MRKAYISGISHALGARKEIASLLEIDQNKSLHDALLGAEGGLKYFRKSEAPFLEMVEEVTLSSLDATAVDIDTVDGYILATSSLWDSSHYRKEFIGEILRRAKLKRAYPFGLFYSECNNFQSAIRLAKSLISSDEMSKILVVVADQAAPDRTRIIPPNLSIGSDAAAACLVTAEKGGYVIGKVAQIYNAGLTGLDPKVNGDQYMKAVTFGMRGIWRELKRDSENQELHYTKVITNNYNKKMFNAMSSMLGIPREKFYDRNLATIAHAYACDNLINLKTSEEESPAQVGDYILMLGSGTQMWGGTTLQRID